MADVTYIDTRLADSGFIATGTVRGQPCQVLIPKDRLIGPGGHSLDHDACLAVIVPALERQAAGEDHLWNTEPAEPRRRRRGRGTEAAEPAGESEPEE